MEQKNLSVVAYIRISTFKQETGLSKEAQKESIRVYAKLYGYKIMKYIIERGSAANLRRSGLQKALAYLNTKQAKGLIVFSIDRVTRSLSHFGMLFDRYFKDDKCKLISLREQVDTTTAAGKFQLNTTMAFAQFERERVGERVRNSMELKRSRGEWTGGEIKYGYTVTYEKKGQKLIGRLTENEAEQNILRKVRQLKFEGLSLRLIGQQLALDGLHPRKGSIWHSQTIKRMLDQPLQ